MSPIRIGLVGVGKIARDQHLPVIEANPDYELAAVASRHGRVEGVANFPDLASLLAGVGDIDAISLCTPPQARHALARQALEAGKHVMLEKPPGATLTEVYDLIDLARAKGLALLATWHSRFAPAVEPAKAWLSGKKLRRVHVCWKEDVRHWHPGQEWIWAPGGLGVFDPGINALSIITHLLPNALIVDKATLEVPANRQAPIAATLEMHDHQGLTVTAAFDWRQTGPQTWDIIIETDQGTLTLSRGGAVMSIDGVAQIEQKEQEYANLYALFARLVAERRVDADLAPLRIVADAYMTGRWVQVEDFVE